MLLIPLKLCVQEARPSPERLDAQMRHLMEIQQNTIKNVEEHNSALRSQNETLLQTCQTMASEFKQHMNFYKKMMDTKRESENISSITDELKGIHDAMKNLQLEVRTLADDVKTVKNLKVSIFIFNVGERRRSSR